MALTRLTPIPTAAEFKEIDNCLGILVEEFIKTNAQELADVQNEEFLKKIVADRVIHTAIDRIKLPNANKLVTEYLHAHIYMQQSVSLERDLFLMMDNCKQNIGLDKTIYLLENIHLPNFDLPHFLLSVQPNTLSQECLLIIERMQNLYIHAELKKNVFSAAEHKGEVYKRLLETLMWINGQSLVCITGLKSIRAEKLLVIPTSIPTSERKELDPKGLDRGVRKHLQASIGTTVDEQLTILEPVIASQSVNDLVATILRSPHMQAFIASLNTGSRGGFNTYMPKASKERLMNRVEEFVRANVLLSQSTYHQRNVIKISQYLRQHYRIVKAQEFLIQIDNPDFDIDKFFADVTPPSALMRTLMDNVQQFYIYAELKKNDGYMDADDPILKKINESEMWIGLQRRCCVVGMELIAGSFAHAGQQIELALLQQPFETAFPANYFRPKAPSYLQPKTPAVSSSSKNSYALVMGDFTEEEALAYAIAESKVTAMDCTPIDPPPVPPVVEPRYEDLDPTEQIFIAAAKGDHSELLRLFKLVHHSINDGEGQTLLMVAAAAGKKDTVRFLLEYWHGVLDAQTIDGNKAIHYAAKNKHWDVAAYLISKGANPAEPNQRQETAHSLLNIGERMSQDMLRPDALTKIRELTHDFKMPIDFVYQGKTALLFAAAAGNADVITYMCKYLQPNLTFQMPNGDQAIHLAARAKHIDVVRLLIDLGASPTIRNLAGEFAFSFLPELMKPATDIPVPQVSIPAPSLGLFPPAPAFIPMQAHADSILGNARKILQLLKEQGLKQRGKKDVEAQGIGDSDEKGREHIATHVASVKLAELGMTEQAFYAASDLIMKTMFDGQPVSSKNSPPDQRLTINMRAGGEIFIIQANYRSSNVFLAGNQTLPAPISLVPYDALIQSLDVVIKSMLNGWTKYPLDSTLLIRVCANQSDMEDRYQELRLLENICSAGDNSFKLNGAAHVASASGFLVTVKEESLNKARKLFLDEMEPKFALKMKR